MFQWFLVSQYSTHIMLEKQINIFIKQSFSDFFLFGKLFDMAAASRYSHFLISLGTLLIICFPCHIKGYTKKIVNHNYESNSKTAMKNITKIENAPKRKHKKYHREARIENSTELCGKGRKYCRHPFNYPLRYSIHCWQPRFQLCDNIFVENFKGNQCGHKVLPNATTFWINDPERARQKAEKATIFGKRWRHFVQMLTNTHSSLYQV